MPDTSSYLYPAPVPTPETEPFWNAAREGRLLVLRFGDCGRRHWYPRRICPHCMSGKVEWLASPDTGRVYSYTVMRRAEPPFVLAYVTLDEGPSMLTHLVGKAPDAWAIADEVRVRFAATQGEYPVPVFGPVIDRTGTGMGTGEETA